MQRGFKPEPVRIREAESDCNIRMKFIIRAKMEAMNISSARMAQSIGLKSADTFDQKTRHTERFKMSELRAMFRILNFTADEIAACMKVEP